jgi:hypothetical protein
MNSSCTGTVTLLGSSVIADCVTNTDPSAGRKSSITAPMNFGGGTDLN